MTARPAMAFLLLGLVPPPTAQAQQPGTGRQSHVTVYGEDPCPPSQGDDIVVCARRPEEERYRIPAPFREEGRRPQQSWGSRSAELEEVQRDTRPDSCSVVGSYGQSGCTQQLMRQWRAERRERARRQR